MMKMMKERWRCWFKKNLEDREYE